MTGIASGIAFAGGGAALVICTGGTALLVGGVALGAGISGSIDTM